MFDKNEIISALKQQYEKGDYSKCENSIFLLAVMINTENADEKLYNHELKRILFQTNFVKNPIGGKYKKKDYENIVNILRNVYRLALAINDPDCDTSQLMRKDVVINEGIIKDLVDMIAYTECIYSINKVNTERMDTSTVFQQSFAKQIIAILMYYQDQVRLLKKEYLKNLNKQCVTGMELSVSNRPVEYFEGLKGSYLDNNELTLEGINQIVLYLFYLNKDKLPEAFEEDIYTEPLLPYENVDFEKYLYIAFQRHLISSVEEGIRYGYFSLVLKDKNDRGIKRYVFDFEDESKSLARRFGILRREYRVRSNTIINPDNVLACTISSKYRPELANEILALQREKGHLINIEDFHPQKDRFDKAYSGAAIKINIVNTLTKKYYLGLEVGGIKIKDYLIAYGYLCTLSEVVYEVTLKNIDEERQETFFGELAIVRIAYLVDELSRLYEYERAYSEKLIGSFIFHAKNKHDEDIFADPLVQISKTQVVLSYALLDQVNLDRSIERLFSRYKKDVSEVGKAFEKDFLKTLSGGYSDMFSLKQKFSDNFAVNNNKIKYLAFDGKEIEFDIVSKLDDYLILTELKSVMASYDLDDLENRKQNVKKAVKQLHRRKESVKRDWDTFKNMVSINLPDIPYDDNHIILVACTDSFDYTPLKSDDVYITDDSTYLKYFANPFVESIIWGDKETEISRKNLWKNGHPDAEEFKEYLEKPSTTKLYEDFIEKQYIPVPCMDKNDVEIHCVDLILQEDPIGAQMKQQVTKNKIYPNDPCPCGSGKKYKHCCKKR